jgi:hypothetical protein
MKIGDMVHLDLIFMQEEEDNGKDYGRISISD